MIFDAAYQPKARVRAVGRQPVDAHELRLTPEGTALFTCFPAARTGVSRLDGIRHAQVLESVVQEVDMRSGRLLFEWRSLDHIGVEESFRHPADPFDYLHVNSIDVLPDGHLLISARHAWALYKVHRRTGAVMWRLGGKRSDFEMGPDAQFSWQHDARHVGGRQISLFDDRSDEKSKTADESRGLLLDVDESARRVTQARSYEHPDRLLAGAMGSCQILEDGSALIGWGTQPRISQFAPDGSLSGDSRMPAGEQSYRSYRLPWRGQPQEQPAIAVERAAGGGDRTVYVSWNGATEAAYWLLSTGARASDLKPVLRRRRHGFESAVQLGRAEGFVAVTALDAAGGTLATSRTIRL